MELSPVLLLRGAVAEKAAKKPSVQEPQYPVIEGYGGITPFPEAMSPDKKLSYKVVFGVEHSADSPAAITPSLLKIAGFINSFAAAGVVPRAVEIAVVVHGGAVRAALTDEAYEQTFYTANPDHRLTKELARAGVALFACAQRFAREGYRIEQLNPDFRLALSSLVALSTYQLKGFAMIPL